MPGDLDHEFTLDTIADLPAVMARRALAAEAALARWPVHRGLRYGDGPGETLNIFPAAGTMDGPGGGKGPAPVLLFIHGGFWRSLDADLFSFVADGFVDRGAMVVVIDYPLMPGVRMAAVVAACERALRWTHANAARFGGDPARITLCGNSAGGHLVAELADRPRGLAPLIAAAVPISGIYDLHPVTRSFQNDSLDLSPGEVAGFSPLCRAYDPVVPVLAAVGGDETGEFLRQNRAFAAACTAAGKPSLAVEVPATNHITVLTEALARPGHPFNQSVLSLMGLA